jgi:ribosomal protein L13E
MRANRGEYAFVANAELLARQLRAESRMQDLWICPLERIDRKAARLTFAEQSFRRIEASKVVQHSRKTRAIRSFTVAPREAYRHARDAQGVGVPVALSDGRAYSLAEIYEAGSGHP